MTGKVRFFSEQKHYGFIVSQGGDYFFHRLEIVGARTIEPYTAVEFEVGEFKGRTCAKNVRPVEVGVRDEVQQ